MAEAHEDRRILAILFTDGVGYSRVSAFLAQAHE